MAPSWGSKRTSSEYSDHVAVCTWTEQNPGQRQMFPVIWCQSCSDLLGWTGVPPLSTESEHCPPSTHTHTDRPLRLKEAANMFRVDVWVLMYMDWCVTWCTRYSSSSRMFSLCSVVELLPLNWISKRLIIYNGAHIQLNSHIQFTAPVLWLQ